MPIDPRAFIFLNVTDTCAVWNVLSSALLFSVATESRCHFCMTGYVNYECLIKRRSKLDRLEEDLKERLHTARNRGQFKVYSLDLEDLAEIEILEKRRNLGKGELSSIAFAKRTGQAFLTDDQAARELAGQILGLAQVQTTPHLAGWLFFLGHLSDSDKETIVKEHSSNGRPLSPFFEQAYLLALQYRLSPL